MVFSESSPIELKGKNDLQKPSIDNICHLECQSCFKLIHVNLKRSTACTVGLYICVCECVCTLRYNDELPWNKQVKNFRIDRDY